MPEDTTARIIVAVESQNAAQSIDRVKKGMSGLTDARMRDLQIVQAKSKLELAEYNSNIAAQKAYNAELQIESMEKLKARYARKGDVEGVNKLTAAIERNRGKLFELQVASNGANLKAYEAKLAYQSLLAPLEKNADATDKLTKRKAALRTVSRLLHMDLDAGNAAMLKAGLYAVIAAATVKNLTHIYELSRKSLHYNAELALQSAESQHEVTQRIEQRIEKEREALSVVSELGNKENRSVEETVRLAEAVRTLGGEFEKLAEKIDIANGGIGDFSKISDELALKQIRRQRMALKADLNDLKGALEEQTVIRDTAGFSQWLVPFLPVYNYFKGEDVRLGGGAEAEAANNKIAEIQAKQLEIQNKLYELRKQEENLIKNREVKAKAQAAADEKAYADAQEALEDRIGNLNKQREIQELTNKGLLREAELLRINMKLDQERTKLSGQELTAFDEQRQNILEAEMDLFDTRSAGKQKGKKGENLLASMAKEFFKYRSTTQGAISANSVEGMRLQSRIFTNTSTDPAKQSADHLKKIEDQNKTIVNAVQNLSRLLTGISGNGLKLAGVATKKY